ncbi:MAG: hypothetical protein LLF78_03145 [Synergistaceae bacterium]|nr:hypothetical protein [Synergistaceae bacterium]
MLRRIKLLGCAAGAVIVVLSGLFLFFAMSRSSNLLSVLPKPSGSQPYAIIETRDSSYPEAFSALLTDGIYAQFRKGTSRNCLFTIASLAQDCAMLVEEQDQGTMEVYAALRFAKVDMKELSKGKLPDLWKGAFKAPRIEDGPEKGTWELYAENTDSPIYFKVESKRVLIAAGIEPFKRLLAIRNGDEKGLGKKRWKDEKAWPGHIELCDGGDLFSSGEKSSPLKLQAAWRNFDAKNDSDPAGEAKWTIEGLSKKISSLVPGALEPMEWDTSNCIIPEPLLLSVGMNFPEFKGSPKDWPFPLRTIGELGHSLELNDKQIRKILSGQTIISLGGQNRILWFTLPGFTIEFTGKKDAMQELVSAFWDKLFYGAEPKPLDGFEYGGTANIPFSVIGAGRDEMALLGLTSPESIKGKSRICNFLKDDEKAIGWIIADLPRIGLALSDMAKISSFVSDSEGSDGLSYENGTGSDGGALQPELPASPFDQSITDSFSNVLRGLGKILIVWEKPGSGRINWYRNVK